MTLIHINGGVLRVPASWDYWTFDDRLYKRVRGKVLVQGSHGVWGLVITRDETERAS